MFSIFRIIASAASLYTFLCFLRILLTWIQSASYSPVTRFLAALCDPYLNLFKGIRCLRFSMLDFSPILAFMILFGISTLCSHIAINQTMTIGFLLATLISMIWDIFSYIVTFFTVFLIIRLVVLLTRRDSYQYGTLWNQVDSTLNPIIFRISGTFSGGRPVSFKKALIISIITMIVVNLSGQYIIVRLTSLLKIIPF